MNVATLLARDAPRFLPRAVNIVASGRTPIGSFLGRMATVPVHILGATVINHCLRDAGVDRAAVGRVILGHAIPAGCGPGVARQAALAARLPPATACFSVNMACSSGLKAITCAAESISLGIDEVVIAGGVESMSQSPHLALKYRSGPFLKFGNGSLTDSLLHDGLVDPISRAPTGKLAEELAASWSISREEVDKYALLSHQRALKAWNLGETQRTIVPVRYRSSKLRQTEETSPEPLTSDEELDRVDRKDISSLSKVIPLYKAEGGIITSGNSAGMADGAAAVLMMSDSAVERFGLTDRVQARILAFAEFFEEPRYFGLAPVGAIRLAVRKANSPRVDVFELNDPFSATALVCLKSMNLDPAKVNMHGGAVSLGDPLGMSGARLVVNLISVLHTFERPVGCAAISNVGGGAAALLIECTRM